LEAIEAMMDEHPDSALMLLTKLDHKSLTNQADSALFNLLLVQAEDKNFIDRTTTERIDIAVNYYRQHPDNDRRLMLSLYYLGNIQNNATLYEQSIISMMEAEQLALKQQDYFYLGLIYRSIAGIYFKVYDVQDEITYEKKSVDAFAKSGHVDYEIYEKCNYANALSHDKRFQEALDTLAVVNKKATEIRDTETLLLMYRFYGVIYFCMGNYDASINAYSSYNSLTSGDLPVESLQVYALSYAKIGCSSKADSIISKIKDLGGEAKASLHKTYFNAGNYQQAYNALLREDYFKDSTLNALLQQRVFSAVSYYRLDEQKQLVSKSKAERIHYGVILLLLILTFIVTLVWLHCRKVRQMKLLLAKYDILSNSLKEAEPKGKITLKNWIKVYQHQFNLLDKLCNEYYERPENSRLHSLAKKIETAINELHQSTSIQDEILSEIDEITSGLISELKDFQPVISESDFQLLALLCAGLSSKTISIIINSKIETVYNRKSRLKAKIKALNFTRKEELLALF
jgi:tetratricopeptide (TPR) repeat protein